MFVANATVMATSSSPPVSSSPATSVADRVAHAFTPHAMVQGFASHGKGVETLTSTRDRFFARVRSKRTHEVSLRADGARLVIACACPAKSLGLSGCKHAWAALLEVDRCAGLPNLRETRSTITVEMVSLDEERPAAKPAADAARPGVAKAASARSPRANAKPAPAKAKAAAAKPAKRRATSSRAKVSAQ